jgi:hypothetical protein
VCVAGVYNTECQAGSLLPGGERRAIYYFGDVGVTVGNGT